MTFSTRVLYTSLLLMIACNPRARNAGAADQRTADFQKPAAPVLPNPMVMLVPAQMPANEQPDDDTAAIDPKGTAKYYVDSQARTTISEEK